MACFEWDDVLCCKTIVIREREREKERKMGRWNKLEKTRTEN